MPSGSWLLSMISSAIATKNQGNSSAKCVRENSEIIARQLRNYLKVLSDAFSLALCLVIALMRLRLFPLAFRHYSQTLLAWKPRKRKGGPALGRVGMRWQLAGIDIDLNRRGG